MKTCYICSTDKPESEFSRDKRMVSGLKNYCKACANTRSRSTPSRQPEHRQQLYQKAMADPLKRAVRNLRANNYYHNRSPRGLAAKEKKSHRAQSIQERITSFETRIETIYGPKLLAEFRKNPFQPCSAEQDSGPRLTVLKKAVISRLTGINPVSNSMLARVIALNKACGLPLLNIGWHCLSCGLTHYHPAFFEIDHVKPRSNGGENGHHNKQCLCPNCHKKKTLQIDGCPQNFSFKEVDHLQLCCT